MTIDPQASAILDQMAAMGGPPINEMSVNDARQAFTEMAAMQGWELFCCALLCVDSVFEEQPMQSWTAANILLQVLRTSALHTRLSWEL